MLRDVPPYRDLAGNGEQEVMRGISEVENNDAGDRLEVNQNAELFDDIFGSAPVSLVLAGQDGDGDASLDAERSYADEHSDIPRLRSTHVTNGYREGIAESKELSIQEGFDEGYSLGAELGMKAGWCLGVLEGVCRALKGKAGEDEGVKAVERYEKASEELKMEKLFGRDYFGDDGIWLFEVPGPEEETTFRKVALAHPVVHAWVHEVYAVTKKYGLTVA